MTQGPSLAVRDSGNKDKFLSRTGYGRGDVHADATPTIYFCQPRLITSRVVKPAGP